MSKDNLDKFFDWYHKWGVEKEDNPLNHAYNHRKRAKARINQLITTKNTEALEQYVFKLVGKRCNEYEEMCGVCEAYKELDLTIKGGKKV